MGNEVSLSLADFRGGTSAISARLRAGASANKRIRFSEDSGPLPSGCKCTPLGFAIMNHDIALLDVLLAASADPRKPVGLPHPYAFAPLHVAAALSNAQAVKRLLTAGADPNARLGAKTGTTAPTSLSPSGTTPCLLPVTLMHTRAGDAPLHIAIDCARSSTDTSREPTDGAWTVIEALLAHSDTNPNQPNARNRTPLYKACKRRLSAVVTLLASHTRVDINAGGPLFAAIQVEDSTLVQQLLAAGADATGTVRYDKGETPLQYAMHRVSPNFRNRAEIVTQLIAAGAVVEPDMISYAAEKNWQRVLAALRTGERQGGEAVSPGSPGSGHSPSGSSSSRILRTISRAGTRSPRSPTVSALVNAMTLGRRRSASAAAPPEQDPRPADPTPARSEAVPALPQGPIAQGVQGRPSAAVVVANHHVRDGRVHSASIGSLCNAVRRFPPLGIVVVPIILPLLFASALEGAAQHIARALQVVMLVVLALAVVVAPALVYFAYHVLRVVAQLLLYVISYVVPYSSPPDVQHGVGIIESTSSRAGSVGGASAVNESNQTLSVANLSISNLLADAVATSDFESARGQPTLLANQSQQLPSIVNSTWQSSPAGGITEAVLNTNSPAHAAGDMADNPITNSYVRLGVQLWYLYIGFFIALVAVGTAMLAANALMTVLGSGLRRCLSPARPLHVTLRNRAVRWKPGGDGDLPRYVWFYFSGALALRWALGMSYWTLAVPLTGCFIVHEVYGVAMLCWPQPRGRGVARPRRAALRSQVRGWVAGMVDREGGGGTDLAGGAAEGSARPPGSEVSEPLRNGNVGSGAREGGIGNVSGGGGGSRAVAVEAEGDAAGGLHGLCCVCMASTATQGFVHSDVVHCCLCVECEGEMRKRRQLSSCLICKRTASAVIKVVAT